MRTKLFWFSFTVLINLYSSKSLISSQIKQILKSYDQKDYDKNIRPNYGEEPVFVTVNVNVNDISSIDEVKMEYTLDIYLRQTWTDDRLAFNESIGVNKIVVGGEYVKKIWIPDTFFVNGRKTELHISSNTEPNSLIRIRSNGQVFYSTRITIQATCPMDLKYFPLDSQTCGLVFESYGYALEDVEYFWDVNGFENQLKQLSLPNFEIMNFRLDKVTKYSITGNYSNLIFKILLSRSLGFYLNQVYLPSILIVIISWIPFWLNRDDTHARVGLGVTTVLTMTTLVTQTNETMPKISYLKALDIYLEVAFAMVFASLIQYAIVSYFTVKDCKKGLESHELKEIERKQSDDNCHVNNNHEHSHVGHFRHLVVILRRNPSKIDWHSRWVFPATFVLFNIVYWAFYVTVSKPKF